MKWIGIEIEIKERITLTMEGSLRGRVKVWSDWTWRGMSGEPTSFNKATNSWLDAAERWEALSAEIWALMRARRFCQRLAPLLPMLVHMSSGIGTSSTVSNPSTLSKFGHSFLIQSINRFSKFNFFFLFFVANVRIEKWGCCVIEGDVRCVWLRLYRHIVSFFVPFALGIHYQPS